MKRNVGQNLRINKWYIFMMLPENELPLFERPAAATALWVILSGGCCHHCADLINLVNTVYELLKLLTH